MKQIVVALAIGTALIGCKNNQEKTAGATSQDTVVVAPQPVVVQKEVRYVNTAPRTTSTAPVEQKKKGWSKAAKGAAIGAGVGAVTGAVVSKKKGKGAVIGGVVGGTAGYIIGRNKDKKDGRVQ